MRSNLALWGVLIVALSLGACAAPSTPPDLAITYINWSGWSPGAGFGGTTLFACQYDLRAHRLRALNLKKGPSSMDEGLPWQRDKIIALLGAEHWRPLTAARARALQTVADTWLSTAPPPVYEDFRMLGTEDGYVEELVVTSGIRETRTTINARGGNKSNMPPPEWHALVAVLREFTDLPQGHPGQIMQVMKPEASTPNR